MKTFTDLLLTTKINTVMNELVYVATIVLIILWAIGFMAIKIYAVTAILLMIAIIALLARIILSKTMLR
jgi:hypothetical protein